MISSYLVLSFTLGAIAGAVGMVHLLQFAFWHANKEREEAEQILADARERREKVEELETRLLEATRASEERVRGRT